jgi:hypothetical protein
MDPEYTLVAHIIVVQYESWHEGIQERGEDAVSKNSLSCTGTEPIHPRISMNNGKKS